MVAAQEKTRLCQPCVRPPIASSSVGNVRKSDSTLVILSIFDTRSLGCASPRQRALRVFPPSDEKHRQRRVLPKRLNQYRGHHSNRESQLKSFPRAGLHSETVRHSPWSAAL